MSSPDASAEGPPGLVRCTGYVFGHAGILLLEAVEEALAPYDVQMRHVAVMLVLSETESPLSQQDLSRLLKLDPTRMVAVVDDLERWRYAERRKNPEDRRRYIVTLTARGRRALDDAMKVVDDTEAGFFEPLDADERETLGAIARRLMAPRWAPASKPE